MDERLQGMLTAFGVPEIYEDLIAAGIEYRHLRFVNNDDINQAIRTKIGARAMFRVKLYAWRAVVRLHNIPFAVYRYNI